MEPKRRRNIHRRDGDHERGWFGLAQRGSVVHKKSFADGAHGRKRKVLDVAIGWIRAD